MAIDDSLVPGRLVVVEIDATGPARDAGIRLQDMVLAVNGEPTIDADRFAAAVAAIAPGEEVRLAVGRGGQIEELRLTAGTAPGRMALGVRSVPVDAGARAACRLPDMSGALVVGVIDDMPASRAGLTAGSVIVALDERPVRSPSDLTRLVSESPSGQPVQLEFVLPGGESRKAEVSLVAAQVEAARQAAPAPAGGSPLLEEIRGLRSEIERLTRRLGELERRVSGGR